MTLPQPSMHGSILKPGYSFEDVLSLSQRFGFPGVDASFAEVRARAEQTSAAAVREFFAEFETSPAYMGFIPAGLFSPEVEFMQALDQFSENCALAASVGCQRTGSFFPNRMSLPPDEARRILRDRVAILAERAEPHGIAIGLEFIGLRTFQLEEPHAFLNNVPDTIAMLRETGRPNVGLILDSFHYFTSGGDLSQIRSLRAEDIVHLHVNDAPHADVMTLEDTDRVLPGKGVIDLTGWFQAIAEIGFDGYVAIEIFDDEFRNQDWDVAVGTAKEALDAVLAQTERSGD